MLTRERTAEQDDRDLFCLTCGHRVYAQAPPLPLPSLMPGQRRREPSFKGMRL